MPDATEITALFDVLTETTCDDLCENHNMACAQAATGKDIVCGAELAADQCSKLAIVTMLCKCVADSEPVKTEDWSLDDLCPSCFASTNHDASATGSMKTEFKIKKNT